MITVDGIVVASGAASDPIALVAGVEKTIVVVATETGKTAKTYTIKITRQQEASADLTGLALSGSPVGYAFAATTYDYPAVTVLNAIDSITVTPTGAGVITVDGTVVVSGAASGAIALVAGVEKTIVVVATETGKTAKTYTIKITRAAS